MRHRLTGEEADEGEGHDRPDEYGEREPSRDSMIPSPQPPHVGREAFIGNAIRRNPGI
ncbi:MAG: hypothetical protein ABR953_10580 [Candidatus Acidiferrales bacterium]|jgi:hypothetical protein